MSNVTIQQSPPHLTLAALDQPQVCYVLLTVAADVQAQRPVNWALVADASRSMRVPIVDEAQFRALIQQGGAQETLVDGVPVWQLRAPVPADVRAAAPSPLDHVARALHTIVERLDGEDRLTLVGCAEEAALLARSTSGAERAAITHSIERLRTLNLGDATDLARGLRLALEELRRGRDKLRVDRLLLLTDGFTQNAEACVELARQAAGEGVTITTVGLGGEFQDELLRMLADVSGGRALFIPQPAAIPQVIAHELRLARAVSVRALSTTVTPERGVAVRRVTRIRPSLAILAEPSPDAPNSSATVVALGDLSADAPLTLLLELLVPPGAANERSLGRIAFAGDRNVITERTLRASVTAMPAVPPPDLADAAARVNLARLQRRAEEAVARGILPEAARLFRATAARLDTLGEASLADAARQQAAALDAGVATPAMQKALTYATRRLG